MGGGCTPPPPPRPKPPRLFNAAQAGYRFLRLQVDNRIYAFPDRVYRQGRRCLWKVDRATEGLAQVWIGSMQKGGGRGLYKNRQGLCIGFWR